MLGIFVASLLFSPSLTSGDAAIFFYFSNAKNIHLSTIQAEMDGATTNDKKLGWPGDVGIKTVKEFVTMLSDNDYIRKSDLPRLFSRKSPAAKFEDINAENIDFRIYALSVNSPTNAVFLMSREPVVAGSRWAIDFFPPKRVVVCLKNGEVKSYKPEELTGTNFGIIAAEELR